MVGVGSFSQIISNRPAARGGQFLDSADADGGCDPKLDLSGASILGCRGKLAGGYRGAVGDGVAGL